MITKNEISSLNLSPTKKDFVQIWNELIEVASKITERWDPTSTNESDPGIVLLKVLAGIADKLNYNIDKNILEAYMPTAAQMESMRKLCELVGYDIKYYQSAETKVRISYAGNTEDEEEKLPAGGLALPKFTAITNADKDITFVTTNTIPVLITNDTPWVEVDCIEGQISQCESINENNLITLSQLDANNRYYLPEIQIAENGIFIYNVTTETDNTIADSTPWKRVSNLNAQPAETRVFKFGYDSFEGRPYIAFPADVGSLIGDGLFIYFVRTSGLSGNISPRTLEVLELPSGEQWSNYSAEKFEVVNVDATTNGANIESISAAYNNFKKTVGTFDTLVTCRDYMNKIYSLMDASNSPYVSNILVTDIRNDINKAITLCSCDEYGILYRETPITKTVLGSAAVTLEPVLGQANVVRYTVQNAEAVTEDPLLDHFDLVLYPFKTFTQVSASTKDKYLAESYNNSFTYTEQMNREIEASLADLKTCAHNLTTPDAGDVVAINNYLRLNALIATSIKVSEAEAESILQNVKVALVNEFNLRNLDFGEEIPFDSILSVIENADSRIKVVSLQEPTVLTTYSVKESSSNGATSNEYGIATTLDGKIHKIQGVNYTYIDESTGKETEYQKAKDIYNKLVLRNILAGRASLFDYDETFIPNNAEKPYTATKDITTDLNNKPNDDETAKKIKAAIVELINDPNIAAGDYILYDESMTPIKQGLNSSDSLLTLKVLSEDITSKVADILKNKEHPSYSKAEEIDGELQAKSGQEVGSYNLDESGLSGGVLTLVIPKESTANIKLYEKTYEVYETYEPFKVNADTKDIIKDGIISDVTRVEAVCEIQSAENTFKNIKLSKNEVIKFRAPNLITTKTFPAYVYYRFELGNSDSGTNKSVDSSVDGSFAKAITLSSFINQVNGGVDSAKTFFSKLWEAAGVNFSTDSYNFKAELADPNNQKVTTSGNLADIFNSAIVVEAEKPLNVLKEGEVAEEGGSYDKEQFTTYSSKLFFSASELTRVLQDHFKHPENTTPIKFRYYPLTYHTSSIWSSCIREFDATLPAGDVLWKLSSTSSYPKGKLVLESGKKLIGLDGDSLALGSVSELVYICKDLGTNPNYSVMSEGSSIELRSGDKLYIHYTPSSTNEDGSTKTADPVSIVYDGDDEEPVIIKPSGFTLMSSEDVHRQGTAWKKTDVNFGKYGPKNLLALAPNEQIELRNISKVVLNTTARFYKNFDNVELENGNINDVINYELKDGEYLFYTDRNSQETAYYGSGSVITLDPGAFIPKATELVEVSQILERGLHIVPWSPDVLLSESRKITITEYQYHTLVEGDTLNSLTIDINNESAKLVGGKYTIDGSNWLKCLSTEDNPIIYTPAGSESQEKLPKIELMTGPSTSWEVCSFLELSTSPGYSQQLRKDVFQDEASSDDVKATEINNKIKVYTGTATTPTVTIEPATTKDPVSIKLSTIVQTASGSFEKTDSDQEDDIDDSKMQMKVFKEEFPKFVELSTLDDVITPISNKPFSQAEIAATNIGNSWTRLEVGSQLGKSGERPHALNLNFMIPENDDVFGIFSIYLDVPEDRLGAGKYGIPKDNSRVFIDIPKEFGSFQLDQTVDNAIISIFNCKTIGITRKDCLWWPEGVPEVATNRLYLRAGLNCIRVNKSCSLLIKAEASAAGSLLYDNMRLVRGRATHGINLALLDPDATFNIARKHIEESNIDTDKEIFNAKKINVANNILSKIAELDKNHDFYYNVPIENSLAIEFDKNIDSFSNPQVLYDINNVNNDFVISKLDIKYLKDGLKIAKSSKY